MAVEIFTKEDFEQKALPKLKNSNEPAWKSLGLVQREYAYLVPLPNDTAIHVRSSVDESGNSAGRGEDSIRCWIVDAKTGQPMGGKISKWTTRVPGWGDRTQDVIRQLANMAIKIRLCPGCGKERLKVFKVKKEGANKGRPFATCKAGEKGCGFFEWLDVATTTEAPKPAVQSPKPTAEIIDPKPCPDCGGQVHIKKVRKKEGEKNHNRPYATCLGAEGDGCGYFKWLDEEDKKEEKMVTIAFRVSCKAKAGDEAKVKASLEKQGFEVTSCNA